MLQSIIVPLDRDGWRFVFIFACMTLILWFLSPFLGVLGGILTAWCFYFFRDPQRVTPNREGLVISPADGLIVGITETIPPKELNLDQEKSWTKISIFLNVFDVHVNRIPIKGILTHSVYHPGQFLNASFDKASELNERHSYVLETDFKKVNIVFVQIAGLVARRIRSDVQEGEHLKTGQRFGIIRFGSRVDVYLPQGVAPLVCEGQRTLGGETVLADLTSQESPREGMIC